ncbi:MAG: chromate efflux transporter [Rhodospirillales bacterium]
MDKGHKPAAAEPHPVPFNEAFKVWLKIGLISFGGPAGQIALMHRILVEEKRWISDHRFLHALNYCMLLPGPEAQQLATYIGWLLHRTWGGLVAGTLFILPGFFVVLGLSTLYAVYQELTAVQAIFFGIKAAVLAVVIQAVVRIGKNVLKNAAMISLAAFGFIAIFFFNVPFPIIVIGAGVIGYIGGRYRPETFVVIKGHGGHGGHEVKRAVVDEMIETGRADHIRPSAAKAITVTHISLCLWFAPVALAFVLLGEDSVFVDIGAFFSKMAVVTFGGAYAVLAYVAQEAVQSYGWLQPGEMLNGLGLAETTPGPLILVTEFVGYLAAYRNPGPFGALGAGTLGAFLTVWVTFVPCYLWIFLGAPYMEAARENLRLSAALSAITAVVVGVILNLAVWFGLHVLFAKVQTVQAGPLRLFVPEIASADLGALALALLALFALFRLKWDMLKTLAACAALGAALFLSLG